MKQGNTGPRTQKVTNIVMFSLLVWRIASAFLIWLVWSGTAPYWEYSSYLLAAYASLTLVLWLNIDDLKGLNIDRTFVTIYAAMGVLVTAFYFATQIFLGILLGVITAFIILVLQRSHPNYRETNPNPQLTVLLVLVLIAPTLIALAWRGARIDWWQEDVILKVALVYLPTGILDELLFRSLLWKYLTSRGLSKGAVIAVQAVLYWIASVYSIHTGPFDFWLWSPFIGFLAGAIVSISESITPTTVGGFLWNFISAIRLYDRLFAALP